MPPPPAPAGAEPLNFVSIPTAFMPHPATFDLLASPASSVSLRKQLLTLGVALVCSGAALAQHSLPPEFAQALAKAGIPANAVSVVVGPVAPAAPGTVTSTVSATTATGGGASIATATPAGTSTTASSETTPATVAAPAPAAVAGSGRAPPAGRKRRAGPAPVSEPDPWKPRLSHRPDAQVNPASVMKLVTTYAGLDMLGPTHVWKNRVYIDGFVVNGVLDGHLVVRGSGDPKFVLERIDALFREVIKKGVREVRGDLILDRSIFDVPDSNPAAFDDEPLRPYNVAPDGLLVNFKSLILTFTPESTNGGVRVRSEPPMAGVDIPVGVPAARGPCNDWRSTLKADFSSPERVRFAGAYPGACGERVWPVAYPDPRGYAGRVLKGMWLAAGGTLAGEVREARTPPTARLWVTGESPPLSDVIADINKFSNNVMAQQLFLTLSAQGTGHGSFEASQRIVTNWWRARFGRHALPVLENGSGLSRNERSTALALTALLQRAALDPNAPVFAASLGIAGVDGTVARMRERNGASEALGNAQLKTGSLRDVAAVAGYATGRSGQRYTLVAVVNHANAPAARPALDKLVEWVVRDAP